MNYAESIQLSIETQDTHSTRISNVLAQMWKEIFDKTDGKIAANIEPIVSSCNKELATLIGERFRVQTDDIVFVSPQIDHAESGVSTVFPDRPAEVSGEFIGLTSVDAESLPDWASVFGRPVGSIPGLRILNAPENADAIEYEYFIPVFSINAITNA